MPSPTLTLGSFLVAIMVGLTGMGGGALLTPMLMLVFGVPPLAAVSSDLVVSAITKPVGALVHLRRGTVNLRLAGWLTIGSVPSAFLGGLLGWWLGPGGTAQTVTARATGVVLLIAAAGVTARTVLIPLLRRRGAGRPGDPGQPGSPTEAGSPSEASSPSEACGDSGGQSAVAGTGQGQAAGGGTPPAVRKIPTLLIGIIVGLAVGITSTGSGTLVIAALAVLYPALPAGRLVGTDLAQAVPMVLAAALAHLIAGDVQMGVTTPLLVGGIPGVIIGSLLASRAPNGLLRPVLAVVVLASGLSLLGLSPQVLALVVGVIAVTLLAVAVRARWRRAPARQDERAQQERVTRRPAADLD